MQLHRSRSIACLAGVLLIGGCSQNASDDAGKDSTSAAPATSASPSPSTNPSPSTSVLAGDARLKGQLLFSRFDESTHTFVSTHTSGLDGSRETEIPMPGSEGGGRWSNSGDNIAVATELNDDRIGTAILRPDGSVVRVFAIPQKGLNLPCTVWARDDKRLACEGWDNGDPSRAGIYTVRASDGGGLVRLTRTPPELNDLLGDYSPDGSTVLFKRSSGEDPGPLMVVPAAGGRTRPLADLDVEDPARYSRDGRTILTSAGGRILTLDATGRETGEIKESGSYLFGPVWSPDGRHIAYSGTPSGTFAADIFTARPDGTDLHRATSTPDNEIRVEWGRE